MGSSANESNSLHNRVYRTWLLATTGDRYGGAVQALALTLLAYTLTGSSTESGLVGTVRMILSYSMAAVGGVIIDRHDRRKLMLMRAVLNGAVWGVFALLVAFGKMTYPVLLAFAGAGTILGGLIGGAGEAALRSLVSREAFVRASAINRARDASADVLGGPLAGALYAVGHALPWLFSLAGYLVLGIAAAFLPPLPPRQSDDSETVDEAGASEPSDRPGAWSRARAFGQEAAAGFRWLLGSRQMVALLVVGVLVNISTLLVLTAFELGLLAQGTSAARVGLISTAEAVGVMLGSLMVSRLVESVPTGRLIVFVHAGCALAMSLALFNQRYEVLLASCFLFSLLLPAEGASVDGYVFGLVPTDMQGRVEAAMTLLVGLPISLTGVVAGALVGAEGMKVAVLIGVIFCLLAFLVCAVERTVRTIPKPADWPEQPMI